MLFIAQKQRNFLPESIGTGHAAGVALCHQKQK
jgi:hypothetical protein